MSSASLQQRALYSGCGYPISLIEASSENWNGTGGSFLQFTFSVAVVALSIVVYGCLFSARTRSVYGPKRYPIVGSLPSYWKNSHRLHAWYTELLTSSPTQTILIKRLGDIPTVVMANPRNVEHSLRTRFDNYPKGHQFRKVLFDLLGNGIFNTDGEEWKLQRRTAAHQFTSASLRTFIVQNVQEEIRHRLFPLLEKAWEHGEPLDLQGVFRTLALHNICRIALGLDPGVCPDACAQFQRAFDAAAELSSRRASELFAAAWKIKRKPRIGSEKRLSEAIRVVHGFANDVVRRRLADVARDGEKSWRQDLFSKFIAQGVHQKNQEFLRDFVISFILAGRDTTSAALTWFFWLLLSHPQVERKIYREIVGLLSERKIMRSPSNGLFSYEELQRMNYTEAAICESLRLFPPVPVDSKHALQNDVLPDGTFVGKGMRVTYHPYAMGRMESIWGADCLQFMPERWLNGGGAFVRQDPFKFAVFQGGARICVGKDMAFVQMKSVIASVIGSFELRPSVGSSKFDAPRICPSLSLQMEGGLLVTALHR